MYKIIIRYYKLFFGYFFPVKNTGKIISEINKKKHLCSIDFRVHQDNTIDIVCNWPSLDDMDEDSINSIASKYSLLLHAINFGLITEDITSTLSDTLSSNNPSDRYFAYEVLTKLIDLAERRKNREYYGPVIKPSDVFRHYNINK